jgi:hypothetical protein
MSPRPNILNPQEKKRMVGVLLRRCESEAAGSEYQFHCFEHNNETSRTEVACGINRFFSAKGQKGG